jgi:hypothetical protein
MRMMITVTRDDKSFYLYRNDEYQWSIEVQNDKGKKDRYTIVSGVSELAMLEELQEML